MLPHARPGVLFESLPDGAVLLDTRTEVYFGLNPAGARVWQLLPPASRTLDELCASLARDYPDAQPAALRADVAELLDHLAVEGLVGFPADGDGALDSPAA